MENKKYSLQREESKKFTGFASVDKPWLKYYEKDAILSPLPHETIYQYFINNTKDFDDMIALRYYGKKITYKKLKKKIDLVASNLKELGVKKGEIVTIAMPTCPETGYLFYALNKIGAVANFIHPLSNPQEFKNLIDESESSLMFVYNGCLDNLSKIIDDTNIKNVVVCSPFESMPFLLKKYLSLKQNNNNNYNGKVYLNWNKFLENTKNKDVEINEYEPRQLAVMTHTSGTTGVPKAAMHTNDSFNCMVHQYKVVAKNFKPGDTMITVLPPLASFMLCNCMHMPLSLGVGLELVPKYDKSDIYKYISKNYHGTIHMMGIPPYFIEILTNPKLKKANLSKLGYIVVGGEKIDRKYEEGINDFLKKHKAKIKLTKGYGMTEITSSATYTFENSNKIGSVGIPLVNTNVKIVDIETGKEVQYNEEGEICFSTPTLMNGYYKNSEETKQAIFYDESNNQWIKTGDLGYIDQDGNLFVTGRIKRMFLTIGNDKSLTKAFPFRIEKVIEESPFVEKCVVVGMNHPTKNKVPKAYIILKQGIKCDDTVISEIDNLCQKCLRETLLPYEYNIVEKLPVTSIGKIDLNKLESEDNVNIKVKKTVRF